METQKSYYITTEKMSVGYDGKPLIEEVEIMLRKGEILTLLGPNGAGKSTILKSIARQLSLIAGTVRLDGEDMRTLTGAELSKKMAVVMTKRLRGELMTCEDVVATGRYPYTGRFGVLRAEDHAAVQNAMELVQVAEIGDSLFDRISDGQRQRVMLARAICQEPEILILDEPTSYLDVRHKLEFLSILQKLCRERQLTVILSLHELELAEKSFRRQLRMLPLKKEDIEEFLRFAEKEGYADETMQIKSIELSRQGLEHTADMQQREITQKCRLSVGLGAMSGLLILLLLV